jgi:hypothetical protein
MRLKYLIIVLILGMLFLTSCDSTLNVKGIAYNWKNAPLNSQGIILDNKKPSAEYSLTPIQGAKVSILFGRTNEKLEPLNNYTGSKTAEGILGTDNNGVFGGHWLDGFGKGYIKLVVEKEGYYTIEQVLKYDAVKANDFDLIILMVNKP